MLAGVNSGNSAVVEEVQEGGNGTGSDIVYLAVVQGQIWHRDGDASEEMSSEELRDYIRERKRGNPTGKLVIRFGGGAGTEGDSLVAEIQKVGREEGVHTVRAWGADGEYFAKEFKRNGWTFSTRSWGVQDGSYSPSLADSLRIIRIHKGEHSSVSIAGEVRTLEEAEEILRRLKEELKITVLADSEREEPMVKKVREIVRKAGHEVSRIQYFNHIKVHIEAMGEMLVQGAKMEPAGLEEFLKEKKKKGMDEPVLVVSGRLDRKELIEQIRDVAKRNGVEVRGLPGESPRGIRQGSGSGISGRNGKALIIRISEGGRLYALSEERTLEEFGEILRQQDPAATILVSVHSERERSVAEQVYRMAREEGFKHPNVIFDDAPKRISAKLGRGKQLWIDGNEVAFAALKDTFEALRSRLGEKSPMMVITAEARGAEFDLLPERVEQVRSVARDVGIETQAVRFGQMNGLIRGEPYALDYEVPEQSRVKIALRDVQGNTVRSFRDEIMEPGQYGGQWDGKDEDGKDVGPGIYFYTVDVGIYHKVYKVLR